MIPRVIEVASDGCHLERSHGLMTVSKDGTEQGRVPLDDISVLLCNARGLTYSNGLMTELARRGVAVVLCGRNFMPVAWMWPLEGHHVQAMRMRCQLEASKPLRKRLWQTIVRAKIVQQVIALESLQLPSHGLDQLVRTVRSGDPANVEAQAARRYWPLLFGGRFRRNRYGGGPNPFLNYGYTVLRAGVARSVVAAGLHPSISVHHSNRGDSMCLVDDLMEPFRPAVDCTVARLLAAGCREVTREARQELAGVLARDMVTERGTTPLQTCLDRAAQSLAQSFETGKPSLVFPRGPLAGFAQTAS